MAPLSDELLLELEELLLEPEESEPLPSEPLPDFAGGLFEPEE